MNPGDNIKPLVAYRCSNKLDLSAPPHLHDFYQFLYMYCGEARAVVKGEPFRLEGHSFMTIPPHTRHEFIFPPLNSTRCLTFQMKCRLGANLRAQACLPLLIDCTQLHRDVEITLDQLNTSIGNRLVNTEQSVYGLMLHLLALLSACFREKPHQAACVPDERIQDTVRFIGAHHYQVPNAAFLAERVALNESYFIRLFKKNMGTSPLQYIIAVRMELARKMLLFSSAPLKEIAGELGYPNYHHFSNQFQDHFGQRPKEFRRRMLSSQSSQ